MSNEKRLRDKKIKILVTEEERELMRQNAEINHMKLTEYMREKSVNGIIINRKKEDLMNAIKPIGNRINEIAKRVNIQDKVTPEDIDDLRKEYEEMFEVVHEYIMNR